MDNKYLKLAEGKNWKKLTKIADGKKTDEILMVAEACGICKDQEPYNILVSLLAHADTKVKLAAISGMSNLRYDASSQITRLQWVFDNTDDQEIKTAITNAVLKIREARDAKDAKDREKRK